MEADIATILRQTSGIDQIKKDLKVLNEFAGKKQGRSQNSVGH